ncbi:hypothetical protein ES703_70285 [subsurface metagenome]
MIIIGGLVVRAAILLDYVDGSVARYRGTSSPEGTFLDKLSDDIPQILLFIFLSFGMYQNLPHMLVFAIGCVAVMSIVLKTFMELCQDSTLLKMIIERKLQARKILIQRQKTGRPDGSFIKRIFSIPEGVMSRMSSSLRYPYHTVDLFIVAAVIDLILERGFPSITMPFSIVLAMLTIYGVFSLLYTIARLIHIVQTRHIQFLYASLSATGTTPDNTTENQEYPPKSLED